MESLSQKLKLNVSTDFHVTWHGAKSSWPRFEENEQSKFFCLLRRWLLTMNISFQSEDEDQLVVPGHGMPKAHRDCWWVEGKPSLSYFSVLYDLQNFVKHIPINSGASLLREEDGPGGWGRHPWWRVQGNHRSQSIIWACVLPLVKTPYPCVQRILRIVIILMHSGICSPYHWRQWQAGLPHEAGYPDQWQGEAALEEGNHLLPSPQGCKFPRILIALVGVTVALVLVWYASNKNTFIFRERGRGSLSAGASSTATSPSSPWPSSRRERLRWLCYGWCTFN